MINTKMQSTLCEDQLNGGRKTNCLHMKANNIGSNKDIDSQTLMVVMVVMVVMVALSENGLGLRTCICCSVCIMFSQHNSTSMHIFQECVC